MSAIGVTAGDYVGYDLGYSDERIAELFALRYGNKPERIWRDKTIAHAGPLSPEQVELRKAGVGARGGAAR